MLAFAPALAALVVGQVTLPGTQPNELTIPVESSATCSCHDAFDNTAISEPGQSYKATLMALSARDPVFRAAFQVARQDRPNLSELCLRCHAPTGWLADRSSGELSELEPEDLESVTCDLCHRMVPANPPLIGSGQYTVEQSTAKRSSRGNAPPSGHNAIRFPFTASSELCASCHSLFNPTESAHDAMGRNLGIDYYEQRTYEEWRDSAFPARNTTCITCHMKRVQGAAVRGGASYADLWVHGFVGGNSFAVRAIRMLNPTLPIAAESVQITRWVEESLNNSATLEIASPATRIDAYAGDVYELGVKLTNLTGHKLPTGYPEGRRVYLEVTLELDGRVPEVLSGAWDEDTGDLVRDAQIRTYETAHGRVENGDTGTRTHHLFLMNQVITDTRLPPEGFMPTAPDMYPAGRDYGTGSGPYRHYDDYTYRFTANAVEVPTSGMLSVRAKYQVIDGEVVRFLTSAAAGTAEAADLNRVYEALGRAPPFEMEVASVPIRILPKPVVITDAGVVMPPPVEPMEPGCGCRTAAPPRYVSPSLVLWLLGLALSVRRAKR